MSTHGIRSYTPVPETGRVQISPQVFDMFYEPLVGTEHARKDLAQSLGAILHIHEACTPQKAYLLLKDSVTDKLWSAAGAAREKGGFDNSLPSELVGPGSFGMEITVAALRALGNTYEACAETPQHPDNVAMNMRRLLAYTYGISFSDSRTGLKNLEACRRGWDPRSRIARPRILISTQLNPRIVDFEKALITNEDADGQLDIRPRYKLRKSPEPGRQCPGAHSQIQIGERTRPALLALICVVGQVAMNEIFPRQFEILPTE